MRINQILQENYKSCEDYYQLKLPIEIITKIINHDIGVKVQKFPACRNYKSMEHSEASPSPKGLRHLYADSF